jgi:ATP/maltotriose-dependent transcriptional regulator MalT
MQDVLAMPMNSPLPSVAQLRVIAGLAQLEALGGDRAAAHARLAAVLPLLREHAGGPWLSLALGLAASLTWSMRHDLRAARTYADESLRVAQTTGVPLLQTMARGRLVHLACEAGDYQTAEQLLDQNLASDAPDIVRTPLNLARVRFGQGDYVAAGALLEELLLRYDPNRSPLEAMLAWTILSWARLAQGNVVAAMAAAAQALILVRDNLGRTMFPGHLPGPLEAMAMVAAAAGQHARALRLAAAAAELRERHADRLTPHARAHLERWLTPARNALGRRATATAWAAGRALGVDAAVADALSLEVASPGRGSPLTPREQEVVALAARGLSNREIGQQLVITEGTARLHVGHVLRKLGLRSRSQLAAWMVQHNKHATDVCLLRDAELSR